MELKTVQKELHRLNELVGAWRDAEDITTIERELVLARLRDLYEAIRFGVEPSTPAVVAVPPVVNDPLTETVNEVEEAYEEEPLVLEADDFFSLDAIETVEEEFEPIAEPEVAEEPVEEEAPAAVVDEEPIAQSELIVEPDPVVEEEPVVEPEPEVVAEPEPIVEPEPEVVAELEPETAPAPVAFQTLFGVEPTEDPHRRKQRVIMSLYDVHEPEPEPVVVQPAPIEEPVVEEPIEEHPMEEEPVIEEQAEQEEHFTPLVAPSGVYTSVDEDEVIEISEEELEAMPEEDSMTEEVVEEEAVADEEVILFDPQTEEQPMQPKVEPQPTAEPAAVLGETIQPIQTLGDQLAAQQRVNDLRPRITDLRRAVGLNDKFLLIRDLFGGNGSLYKITIRKLNEFDNFDDCMIYIAEHFAWNPNSDGAKLMMDLLERKFEQQ